MPPFPDQRPHRFRATVHGIAFAGRDRHLTNLRPGDSLLVIPDPPGEEEPGVWIHLDSGEPIGHLPPEIAEWLWPWLARGGAAVARACAVHGLDVPTWRRLVVEVTCRPRTS
jgi:hypothetical protein